MATSIKASFASVKPLSSVYRDIGSAKVTGLDAAAGSKPPKLRARPVGQDRYRLVLAMAVLRELDGHRCDGRGCCRIGGRCLHGRNHRTHSAIVSTKGLRRNEFIGSRSVQLI